MRLLMMIFYLVLVVIGVSFAVLNANSATLNLYFTNITVPISLLVTLIFCLGIILGFILGLFKYWRLKLTLSKLKAQLKLTEKEIRNLREIPLKNQH